MDENKKKEWLDKTITISREDYCKAVAAALVADKAEDKEAGMTNPMFSLMTGMMNMMFAKRIERALFNDKATEDQTTEVSNSDLENVDIFGKED